VDAIAAQRATQRRSARQRLFQSAAAGRRRVPPSTHTRQAGLHSSNNSSIPPHLMQDDSLAGCVEGGFGALGLPPLDSSLARGLDNAVHTRHGGTPRRSTRKSQHPTPSSALRRSGGGGAGAPPPSRLSSGDFPAASVLQGVDLQTFVGDADMGGGLDPELLALLASDDIVSQLASMINSTRGEGGAEGGGHDDSDAPSQMETKQHHTLDEDVVSGLAESMASLVAGLAGQGGSQGSTSPFSANQESPGATVQGRAGATGQAERPDTLSPLPPPDSTLGRLLAPPSVDASLGGETRERRGTKRLRTKAAALHIQQSRPRRIAPQLVKSAGAGGKTLKSHAPGGKGGARHCAPKQKRNAAKQPHDATGTRGSKQGASPLPMSPPKPKRISPTRSPAAGGNGRNARGSLQEAPLASNRWTVPPSERPRAVPSFLQAGVTMGGRIPPTPPTVKAKPPPTSAAAPSPMAGLAAGSTRALVQQASTHSAGISSAVQALLNKVHGPASSTAMADSSSGGVAARSHLPGASEHVSAMPEQGSNTLHRLISGADEYSLF